jgi:hypothetical protein
MFTNSKLSKSVIFCKHVILVLVTGQWFSPNTPVSSTIKTDHQDVTEILLKVALNTKNQNLMISNSKLSKNVNLCNHVKPLPYVIILFCHFVN